MSTSQMQFMNEIKAGHDGDPIREAKRPVYFQERFGIEFGNFFSVEFIQQQEIWPSRRVKLARGIGKTPDVINRWLGAPSNLTADTISDLCLASALKNQRWTASLSSGRLPRQLRPPR